MASKKKTKGDTVKKTTKASADKVAKTNDQETPAVQDAPATPKKLSALDAAAQVLRESGQAMTTKALIGVMAGKGYWSSPNGQTPHATLYAAIAREIATKGDASRFVKSARGRFALRPIA